MVAQTTPYPRLYLQGGMMDTYLRDDLSGVIDALNSGTSRRLTFSSAHEDQAVIDNLRSINDSISADYPRTLQLKGSVKNLTARTNLSNIIQAHNQRVGANAKGKQK